METSQNKTILTIPLDLSEVLEQHRYELPENMILEMCDNDICNHENKKVEDGELFIVNFVDGEIKLSGSVRSYKDYKLISAEFNLKSKENCSLFGWEYSDDNQIEMDVVAELLTGEKINVLINKKIPLPSRSKLLIFYS